MASEAYPFETELLPKAREPVFVACAPIPIAVEYKPEAVVGVVRAWPELSIATEPKANDFSPEATAAEPKAYESSPVALVEFPSAKALCFELYIPAMAFFPIAVE